MTEPETTQTVADNESLAASGVDVAPAPEPEVEPPQPWTAERVLEWNAYYDIYVVLAALLLVFIVSCNYVTDSQLWLHLKTGQVIAEQTAPVTTDVFSYTEADKPWVDVPWLFQWAWAAIYKTAYNLVPVNPTDQTANRPFADQFGIGTLVVLSALVRLATALLLLKIRHKGPGLWWSALCVTLALGAIFYPIVGIRLGGIAWPATPSPETWGELLLALEVLILFRAFSLGKAGGMWLLLPVFLLWVNVDESFLTGLVVLTAAIVGRVFDGANAEVFGGSNLESSPDDSAGAATGPPPAPAKRSTALIILACCAIVCFATPFTYRAYATAFEPYAHAAASGYHSLFGSAAAEPEPSSKITLVGQVSFFGEQMRKQDGWYKLAAYYLAIVGLGLVSFLSNVRRFAWSRFLPFAAMAVIWAIFMRASPFFAIIFVAAVVPNGQEWYHDWFGTEGRMGWGWTWWSTGGRLVTLVAIFLMVGLHITGWGSTLPDIQFGLGYNRDAFTFAAAEFLDEHDEITGNVLNTSLSQGDILIWKAAPKRKTYVDGRARLFERKLLGKWNDTRKALSEDDKAVWAKLLDEYGITVVMIETESSLNGSPITYRRLMQSTNWVPFYDDGRIVMFGRADAPASDLAFFKANRLDPDLRVYHSTRALVGAERPPNQTSWIDDVFQSRTYGRLQSRTDAARRWLEVPGWDAQTTTPDTMPIPDPARCILAIQEARTALASSPDEWVAYRLLKDTYALLMQQEAALLAGIALKPENRDRIQRATPNLQYQMTRYQQRVTTLNYAIQTTPPPRSQIFRQQLSALHYELFQLYMQGNALDLARDHLQAMLDVSQTEDFVPEMREQFKQRLDQLNDQVKQVENRLEDLKIERQANPLDLSAAAIQMGGVGMAISFLADAELANMSPAVVKPLLIDLYCKTGQPDKALDLLGVGAVDDPNLGSEPGAAALRQGKVYFLLGNYLSAATLWKDRAIPRLRLDRSGRSLAGGTALVRGEALGAANVLLALPATLLQQATWEYELAMCELESGLPDLAAEHFTSSLTLAPQLSMRPIAAYYLEKMGKPVPPPPKRDGLPVKPAVSPVDAPLKPGELLPPMIPGAGQSPAAAPTTRLESDLSKPASGATETTKTLPELPRAESPLPKASP
jgi:tetratricopeptide (TPR) repeat protein